MKLAWVLCVYFIGNLYATNAAEERAPAEPGLGSSYMMAFPMNEDDQIAEESAEAAVKTIAEALISNSDGDEKSGDSEEPKEPMVIVAEEENKDGETSVEPAGILEAQLAEEEGDRDARPPRRPLFKRPKIEELRKILGFPSAENGPQKAKEIPLEKPKAFQPMFAKSKPKMESTPNGLEISFPLRREDNKMRPFGFPILPRNEGIRQMIGFPDLVQAASSIIRRAIIDDMDVQDINNKDDKDDDDDDEDNSNDEQENNSENEEDDEEEEDDEPLVIVPIPDGKDDPMARPPFFRRFPLPLPFPAPRPMPVASRPRLPVPPLAPVALFLPLAQQIMHNIMTRPQPRSQPPPPPMLPISPVQHLIPIQPPMQNFIPIMPAQQNIMQQPMVHMQHHMVPIQTPFFPFPQQSVHAPILVPLPNIPRPVMRPMPRRMPLQQPHPSMARRMPVPNPMMRIPIPQHRPQSIQQVPHQFVNPMLRRPMPEAASRVLPRMVRPPQMPLHPILLMVPTHVPNHVPFLPQPQPQMPVFHRAQQVPFVQQQQFPVLQRQFVQVPQEEERVIFVREDPEDEDEDMDDDQEVLLLVPTDDMEVAQRPPSFMPRPPVVRPPMMSPIQRIRLLRELLMARQANRQVAQMRPPMARSPRIVEIVQQQLRIIPTPHQRMVQVPQQFRADSSELHPVYVPFPHPQ